MSRVKKTEKTVYTFAELSDSAKETARDWWRSAQDGDNYFAESVIDDAARLADIIGINLRTRPVKLMGGGTRNEPDIYWSVGSRDAGASFNGSYSYRKGATKALSIEAPSGDGVNFEGNNELNRIVRELTQVQARNFYQIQASIDHTRNVYTGVAVEVERADSKTISDDDVEIVRELMEDFASWIHHQLESEYEYQMSDEQIDESIIANEYEFDEDGRRS